MNTGSVRHTVGLAFVGAMLVGLGVSACTTGTAAAPAPATGESAPASVPTTASAPATASAPKGKSAPVTASQASKLLFPNTSEDVEFTGYDVQHQLAEFTKVVQEPGSPGAHLIPDPADPGTHRLPMAPNANITSIDPNGFPFETCPPITCTSGDIMATVIERGDNVFWAHIHVNAADQIDSAQEMAY